MQMTLSKALRYKKRVIEQIRKMEADITAENSMVEGEKRNADIISLFQHRQLKINHLIDLKQAILEATQPIRKHLFQLTEEKSNAAFLQRLPIVEGLVRPRYQHDVATTYDCVIGKVERDRLLKQSQDTIDALQTEIDAHNATTTINIEDV